MRTTRRSSLFFFPFPCGEELAAQLARYQERVQGFAGQAAEVIGVSDAPEDSLRQLAGEKGIEFALLSDSQPAGGTASLYGVRSDDGAILPTLFVIDDEGLIRRVYEPGPDAGLPNPAMVARALNKLADTPKPAPVTEDDWQLGPRRAPVTLIAYSDYQCGHCAEAHCLLKEVLGEYRDKILLVHRHYLLRQTHPQAQLAAEAAEAAGAQGKFWEMHDQLFVAKLGLGREQLIKCAQEIGLDMQRFVHDLDSRRFENVVNEKFQLAVRNKVKFPPALFIDRIPLEGPRSKAEVCTRIDRLLACGPATSDARVGGASGAGASRLTGDVG